MADLRYPAVPERLPDPHRVRRVRIGEPAPSNGRLQLPAERGAGQPLKNPGYHKSCSGPIQPSASGRQSCAFYINPSAFSAPTNGQFGNAPHFLSGLRLPIFLNENLSASKRIPIHERLDLQFQVNAFNLFNRVVFSNGGNPNTFIFNNAPADLSAGSLANTGTAFGQLTNQQNGPRALQFALTLEY